MKLVLKTFPLEGVVISFFTHVEELDLVSRG